MLGGRKVPIMSLAMGAGLAASSQVFVLLRRLHAERGITFLVVTHDAHLAERCDRRLEMVDGRLHSDSNNSGNS